MIEKYVSEFVKAREREEILETMYTALKKQVPVTVSKYDIGVKGGYVGNLVRCPSCRENFINSDAHYSEYCPLCGQKLRWSE